jgi:hypothetical protein
MSLFIVRAALELNGQPYAEFKSFQEEPIQYNKQIPLMYTTGTAPVTHRYKFKAEYVVPQVNPFDFTTLPGGSTFTVVLDGGERHVYGGIVVESISETKIDSEAEYIRDVAFIAETKDGDPIAPFGDSPL